MRRYHNREGRRIQSSTGKSIEWFRHAGQPGRYPIRRLAALDVLFIRFSSYTQEGTSIASLCNGCRGWALRLPEGWDNKVGR